MSLYKDQTTRETKVFQKRKKIKNLINIQSNKTKPSTKK